MNRMRSSGAGDLFDPQRWGLPAEAVEDPGSGPELAPYLIRGQALAERLRRVWSRFRECFRTQTRDSSEYAWVYLRGLLTMEAERNFANITRRLVDLDDDGQNLQQFMSGSPWSAQAVFDQIQAEICRRPWIKACPGLDPGSRAGSELSGGILTLDESGMRRYGEQSAGAARQYLGREGKVDLGQSLPPDQVRGKLWT